jgi:hypothetical protein
MADFSRKFSDFRTNLGVIQTTHNWIINVEMEKGKKEIANFDNAKINFRVPSLDGCPPVPEASEVSVDVGGFSFKYYGKIKKDGELSFEAYEDVTGQVGILARKIQRIWGQGMSKSGDTSSSTLVSDKVYFDSKTDVRFKITVQLADNAGNVTKHWIFYDAIGKVEPVATLDQESNAFKYKFTFLYSMFEEGMGVGKDAW